MAERLHDPSRNAVFQVMLSWGDEAGGDASVMSDAQTFGEAIDVLPASVGGSGVAKCDMTLGAAQTAGGGIEGGIEFNMALFEHGSIERLSQRLAVLAASLAGASPSSDVWSLRMMPDDEARLVLHEFNATAADFPTEMCIHDLVDTQARRWPDAVGVEWQRATLTYTELWSASGRVAGWLHARGAVPDCVVALQLHRSLEQVVGVLGVLRSGGAYLPLDPTWPLERRRFMMEDASCFQLVAQSMHAAEHAGWFSGATLALDDACCVPPVDADTLAAAPCVAPSSLAYVIFTSGSTGKPKGVMVPHAGVVNLLYHAHNRYPQDHDWVFGFSQNYAFDMSVFVMFVCLATVGGHLVLLEGPTSLLALSDARITHLKDVPSVIGVAQIPISVKHIHIGGEALTTSVLANVPESAILTNDYGPTELSVNVAAKRVDRSQLPQRQQSIGCPFPNVVFYVVDPESRTLAPSMQPSGVWGELRVGGVQVTRGYLNRPDITADRFVANPWADSDPSGHGVIYRTGDRVRWYADGEIEFGGRIDFQVKVRGQRIELGEIEHALRAQPGVDEAIVLLDKRLDALVAYVSPASTVSNTVGDFTDAVPFDHAVRLGGARGSLPQYMVPSVVVGVKDWPRTSSAKIDRKRLPPPDAVARNMVVAPRTAEEAAVRDAFASVLGLSAEAVSVEASFFELGGNSLKAVVLARRLTVMLEREVRMADVMQRPTAVAMAVGAGDGGAFSLPPLLPSVGAAEFLSAYPVSWNQSQLLTVHLAGGAEAAYNIPMAYWIDGSLDVPALRGALRALVERHAVLCTTYDMAADGGFMQHARTPLEGEALLRVVSAQSAEGAVALIAADASSGFELVGESSSVLRCTLVHLDGTDRHLLLINVHHIAFDGLSTRVMLHDLGALYRALQQGGTAADAALADLHVQYVDYALWQRSDALLPLLEGSRAYWRTQLREGALPVLELPLDLPRPAQQTFDGDSVRIALSVESAARLVARGRDQGCTPFQAVLALWAVLLCRHAGQEEVVIGSPYHGRDAAGTESLIGYFVNMLSLRVDVPHGGSIGAALRGARTVASEGMRHASVPFQQVVNELLPSAPCLRARHHARFLATRRCRALRLPLSLGPSLHAVV